MYLYVGLELPRDAPADWVHLPLIATTPLPPDPALQQHPQATHLLLTSKRAVHYLLEAIPAEALASKEILSIGPATTASLHQAGLKRTLTAPLATQEGLLELVHAHVPSSNTLLLYPHSRRARPLLAHSLATAGYRLLNIELYDTLLQPPAQPIDWSQVDGVIFTSPSTVEAFFAHCPTPPPHVALIPQGPITTRALDKIIDSRVQDVVQ